MRLQGLLYQASDLRFLFLSISSYRFELPFGIVSLLHHSFVPTCFLCAVTVKYITFFHIIAQQ